MRTLIGAVMVLGLSGFADVAGAQQKDKTFDAKKLIGKWELADGKSPIVMEFADKGKLTVSAEAGGKTEKIDGSYKLTDDKLELVLTFVGKEMKEMVTLSKLTDDEWVGKDSKGKEETFKRVKAKN